MDRHDWTHFATGVVLAMLGAIFFVHAGSQTARYWAGLALASAGFAHFVGAFLGGLLAAITSRSTHRDAMTGDKTGEVLR